MDKTVLPLRERWSCFQRKFWFWLYALAGRHVGPETDEYWDIHWWRLVATRMNEIAESGLGIRFAEAIVFDKFVLGEHLDREYRPYSREVRGARP